MKGNDGMKEMMNVERDGKKGMTNGKKLKES